MHIPFVDGLGLKSSSIVKFYSDPKHSDPFHEIVVIMTTFRPLMTNNIISFYLTCLQRVQNIIESH